MGQKSIVFPIYQNRNGNLVIVVSSAKIKTTARERRLLLEGALYVDMMNHQQQTPYFHKVKFGIENAFEMTYDISTSKKGANSIWLAERHGVKQMTAWLFRRKVHQAMKSREVFPLKNQVHVDEFEIGTPQKENKEEVSLRIT